MIKQSNVPLKFLLASVATSFLLLGVVPGFNILSIDRHALGEGETGMSNDRIALEALYHALGGENWTNNHGWLTDEPLEAWYGLRVSEGRVIFLELDDNNLVGEIPAEVGMLDQLYMLDLRWNSITGGIDNLKNLSGLEQLLLSANDLGGSIPESLGSLTSLRRLELAENQFEGSLPFQIGNLHRLESFSARGNKLTGELPAELCAPRDLKRLVLNENELTGHISNTLKNCKSLQHLNLANNQFEGSIPQELRISKHLNWMDLRGNQFEDEEQSVLHISFPGIYIQPEQVDKLNGLAMWGQETSLYDDEKFRLAVVRCLSAISVTEGFLELAIAKVPSDFVEQAKDSVKFINSYLREFDSRISTISDLERMMAKAEKRSYTKALNRLDSMQNVMQFDSKAEKNGKTQDGNGSLLQPHEILPTVFMVDADTSLLSFRKSILHDESDSMGFLKISSGENEGEFSTEKGKIRFTVRLRTSSVYLSGETNLKADGSYEYLSGRTGNTTMHIYYAIHKVSRASGYSTTDEEINHVEFRKHPANTNKTLQVNDNLHVSGSYYARLTVTPFLLFATFTPPFVSVHSQQVWIKRSAQ